MTQSPPYHQEILIAQLAVQRATILTKKIFQEKEKGQIIKLDASPVTIGDFGAQALINHAIKFNFPEDDIAGEEDSKDLKANDQLTNLIWDNVRKGSGLIDPEAESTLGGPIKSSQEMIQAIDQGTSVSTRKGRVWVLDPIDGTKGFLGGRQYAVCLALLVDGEVKLGVLGCPNLPRKKFTSITLDLECNQEDFQERGILLSAVAGQGAICRDLGLGTLEVGRPIYMRSEEDITKAILCEGMESAHSSHRQQQKITEELGLTSPSIRMDSQAKYAIIAMGKGDIYLRLPVSLEYQEKIWDHAAGDIIVREAGGVVTDMLGQKLCFSKGRTLAGNKGIVAASSKLHSKVLDAVKKVMAQT